MITKANRLELNKSSDISSLLGSCKCCHRKVGTMGYPLRYPLPLARCMWLTVSDDPFFQSCFINNSLIKIYSFFKRMIYFNSFLTFSYPDFNLENMLTRFSRMMAEYSSFQLKVKQRLTQLERISSTESV